MCPMCERRALMLEQQQALGEATVLPNNLATAGNHSGISAYFRNPFKTCRNLTHQCCSPMCESQRTSIHSVRAPRISSVRPSPTPQHSGDLSHLMQEELQISESTLFSEEASIASECKKPEELRLPEQQQQRTEKKRHKKGLLRKLKHFTQSSSHHVVAKGRELQQEPSSNDSSFTACGKKVISVAHSVEIEEKHRESVDRTPAALLYAPESDLEAISELSLNLTETNVSQTTLLSMMNLGASFSSPCVSYDYGTLRSSAYDDDASSFAIIPRTSINTSLQDWASDASGLSNRFGELDIGYLSLEESGEAPEFDDTVSISSSQHEDMDLNMHPQDDTVSESDLDEDYSIGTDSQEWCTEAEDTMSILQRSRAHSKKQLDDLSNQHVYPYLSTSNNVPIGTQKVPDAKEKTEPPDITEGTPELHNPAEHICSKCGRKESVQEEQQQQPTTKKVTRKENPMSAYFHTYMKGADHAVMAAKVVVLLGKYGNRKGLRVAGLQPSPRDLQRKEDNLDERLKTMVAPNEDAVVAFQNEVARMMLEGVDVPALNMDVEQFLEGYMKLNSPFYIGLIEDFFKSVCVDCFGQMNEVKPDPFRPEHRRPSCAVLGQKKRKSTSNR